MIGKSSHSSRKTERLYLAPLHSPPFRDTRTEHKRASVCSTAVRPKNALQPSTVCSLRCDPQNRNCWRRCDTCLPNDKEFRRRVRENLVLLLGRFDDIEQKPPLLARIFEEYILRKRGKNEKVSSAHPCFDCLFLFREWLRVSKSHRHTTSVRETTGPPQTTSPPTKPAPASPPAEDSE